jgi:hypothetical protein
MEAILMMTWVEREYFLLAFGLEKSVNAPRDQNAITTK